MYAPAMHAGMDTAGTEMNMATTMEGAMIMPIAEARATTITAKTAVKIAGITNGKCSCPRS